jgi:flagellar L-ring protein FlgH
MTHSRLRDRLGAAAAAVVLAFCGSPGTAQGQTSSLLGSPSTRRQLTLANSSWTYQAPAEPKQWKLNDFVTVMIDEKSTMTREGQVDQRKKVEGNIGLESWVILDENGDIEPDPQSAGTPQISTVIDNKYRSQANLQNRDSLQTSLQCTIVDIRPNGTLVVEGHGQVTVDEEQWELSVSGVIRPDDIMPNNSVKSEKIAEKQIVRKTSGHGRDGVRRGWLQKFLDKFQPI